MPDLDNFDTADSLDQREYLLEQRLDELHIRYRNIHNEFLRLHSYYADLQEKMKFLVASNSAVLSDTTIGDFEESVHFLRNELSAVKQQRDCLEQKLFETETEIFTIWGELIPKRM